MLNRNHSPDSQSRPLSKVDYSHPNEDVLNDNEDHHLNQKETFRTTDPNLNRNRKKTSNWIKLGIPILVMIIIAAIIAGVVASRNRSNSSPSSSSVSSSSSSASGAGSSAGKDQFHVLFSGYSNYGVPQYPTTVNQIFNSQPTIDSSSPSANQLSWGTDPVQLDQSGSNVRADHPRLFAPSYKWSRLPSLISADPYMASWNSTIINNAAKFYQMSPTNYSTDGGYSGSGVLDVAREVQLRLKHWAYAYRVTNDTKWVDRAWRELQVAAGNTTQPFGRAGNNWNTDHWLDVAEFTIGFAIAYDWLYDAWTADQRNAIMWSIINLGLKKGIESHETNAWFLTTNGNWNCVTNGGMVVGSLAIMSEDPSGTAAKMLPLALQSASANCVNAVSPDGTWSETSDYWYFGSQGHAHMTSALQTATGSTGQLLSANPSYNLTGLYHMYVYGSTFKANTGDCGPNKFVATANPMMYYGDQFQIPRYTLYQRDRQDAADPLSMFWYNPQVKGGWFVGLPLDRSFNDPSDAWVSMRSSWTDTNALYVSVKSGNLTGHQTHGMLDAGDLTLDAMGERWIGHLCQNDYLGTGYFSSEGVNSQRWLYYRCRTEGQNTILMNGMNQNPLSVNPVVKFESTGEAQDKIDYKVKDTESTAYWITDLSAAYNGTNVQRGVRLLNGRTQVLVQDEIVNGASNSQWRVHTNATISPSGNSAGMQLNGKKMTATILSPSGATFKVLEPVRSTTSPPLPNGSPDLPNPGVSVLAIDLGTGSQTVSVLFSPDWKDTLGGSYKSLDTVKEVPLGQWSLKSHS
ncbi:chondroitin AC/alginate lyase [Phakopsora pachyrhizi]|nr:chondroitin AC/alginate lyase [Phakopsora pachyrhizi]